MTDPTPGFTGIFLSAELLACKHITLTEKILISWIHALSKYEHPCFASNAYLAEKMESKEHNIAMSLTRLRKKGLIEDVKFDGRVRYLKISEGSLNNLLTLHSQNVNPDLTFCEPSHKEHTYKEIKEESKDKKKKNTKKEKVEKKGYGEQKACKLTDDELHKLIERFGKDGARERINNLSTYILSKGDKYISHYQTILMWESKNKTQRKESIPNKNDRRIWDKDGNSITNPKVLEIF